MEFALILPIFALFTLGIVDVGRAFMVSNQMRGAAREAAAYVQDHPTAQLSGTAGCQDPLNAEWRALNERGAGGAIVEFSPAVACGATGAGVPSPGDEISVTVSKDLRVLTPFVGALVGDGTTMRVSGRVKVVVQGA